MLEGRKAVDDEAKQERRRKASERAVQWNRAHPERRREIVRRYDAANAEQRRAWRANHIEERLKYNREYYMAHAEEKAQYGREYRVANPAKTAEASRRCRAANPERYAESGRKWQRANPAKVAQAHRKWERTHPEQWREICRAKRGRRRNAAGSFNARDVAIMLKNQKGRCWWCSKPMGEAYELDHRIALARGGDNNPANLVLACARCNRRKHTKLPEEFAGRLL